MGYILCTNHFRNTAGIRILYINPYVGDRQRVTRFGEITRRRRQEMKGKKTTTDRCYEKLE